MRVFLDQGILGTGHGDKVDRKIGGDATEGVKTGKKGKRKPVWWY